MNNNRRRALLIGGAMDLLIGAAFLVVGFGFIPFDIGIPLWIMTLIGAMLFIAGIGMIVFNLSRWDE